LALAGCQSSPPAPGDAPPAATPPAAAEIPAGARELHVAADESLLQILVYRGGAMAKLGHNHLIASHRLMGVVYVTDDLLATRFDLRVPVNELTVDEPTLRERAGADFPPDVPQSAREGTQRNLSSEALLDGANHPEIRLRATDVRASGDGYEVGVEVTFKGQTYPLRVPVAVQRAENALTATADFPLRQTELGLKPFSVAMGTLVVLDEMRVRLELVARSH
jgi:polyisoprenoid-binding protein YceI